MNALPISRWFSPMSLLPLFLMRGIMIAFIPFSWHSSFFRENIEHDDDLLDHILSPYFISSSGRTCIPAAFIIHNVFTARSTTALDIVTVGSPLVRIVRARSHSLSCDEILVCGRRRVVESIKKLGEDSYFFLSNVNNLSIIIPYSCTASGLPTTSSFQKLHGRKHSMALASHTRLLCFQLKALSCHSSGYCDTITASFFSQLTDPFSFLHLSDLQPPLSTFFTSL